MADRVRAQNVGNAVVALAQGVSFFHAGQDMLRSKSLDRDSFNSGDWFNRLDFTYQSNNFGVGLPVAEKNESNWPIQGPLLANLALAPAPADIERTADVTQEWLAVRDSSPLFHLETAADVQDRVSFLNTGPAQIPGLIAMEIADPSDGAVDLDVDLDAVVALFNPTDDAIDFTVDSMSGDDLELHPVFVELGPDVTPPTGVAALEIVTPRGNHATFRVTASCTDDRGEATLTADINGFAVSDGDVVFLIEQNNQNRSIENANGRTIWGPSFVLTVTCTDAAGNTSTTTSTADLPLPPGRR
jgi:hypothetical protein